MGYVRGDSKTAKNSRLRLSQKFLSDLEEHYNKIGHRAIEVVFQERPAEYLKFVANLLPKEIELTVDNQLAETTDAELEELIAQVRERRERRLALGSVECRENKTLN
jgi:hypothetical protein